MTTEQRSDGKSETIIKGRAIVFDEFQEATDWSGEVFYEQISSDIRSSMVTKDIFLLHNHDYNQLLGREGRNVTVSVSEKGLDFEWTVPTTSLATDVVSLIRSGCIEGCSFGFYINEDSWEQRDGMYFRTISEIELHEITITPIPFYKSTSVNERSDIKLKELRNGDVPEDIEGVTPSIEDTPQPDAVIVPDTETEVNDFGLDLEADEAVRKLSTSDMVLSLRARFGKESDISDAVNHYTNLKIKGDL